MQADDSPKHAMRGTVFVLAYAPLHIRALVTTNFFVVQGTSMTSRAPRLRLTAALSWTSSIRSPDFARTVPLLIVDSALQLTKASREAVALFDIRSLHSSPHLSQCSRPDGFPNLVDVANEALSLGRVTNLQFEAGDDVYALTCAPIVNASGHLQGATMTFMRTRAIHDEMIGE